MAENGKQSSALLYIVVCLILVIGTAKLLAWARDAFEENHRVLAENLPLLPAEIKQNQIRYLIEEGYLTEPLVTTVIGK